MGQDIVGQDIVAVGQSKGRIGLGNSLETRVLSLTEHHVDVDKCLSNCVSPDSINWVSNFSCLDAGAHTLTLSHKSTEPLGNESV